MPKRVRSAGSAVNKYLNALRREGFDVKLGKSGHWRISFHGELVTQCSASPKDPDQALKKIRNDVARGLARLAQQREERERDRGPAI